MDYVVCINAMTNKQEKEWEKLWKVKALPKIKNFAWKAMHGSVAVKRNLAKRGLDVDIRCPRCGEDYETDVHMLFKCPEARQVWYLSPLRLSVHLDEMASTFDVVKELGKRYKEEAWWSLFWNIAWGIWLHRNAWCFDQNRKPCMEVIQKAISLVGEFDKANDRTPFSSSSTCVQAKWKAPDLGWYKLNTDAAVVSEKKIGLGGVIRDCGGNVLLATCCTEDVTAAPDVAEAIAARYSIKIAHEAGLRRIELESDCIKLVQQLKKGAGDRSNFGAVVNDILAWARACNGFKVSFVRRQGNQVAHSMAKPSNCFTVSKVWLEEYPQEVHATVMKDLENLFD